MIGIYCFTNLVNNKKYIGQSINIEKRVKEHFWKSSLDKDISYNSLLHKAIRKYGKDSFKVEILLICSIEEIDQKEKDFIALYKTIAPFGYNILNGGQSCRVKPIYCKKCNKQIEKIGKTGLCKRCQTEQSRLVERPLKENLEQLLRENNFSKVGKMFGVSDNAIRKWCKNYGLSTRAKDYK